MAGRPIYRTTTHTEIGVIGNRVDALERAIRGGGFYEIKVFPDDKLVTAGNGKFIFAIPGDLDGSRLRYCNAFVTTVSSSGAIELMLRNIPLSPDPPYDMLTTVITIEQGDVDAEDSPDPPVIDIGFGTNPLPDRNNTVYYRQQISIDVDDAGVGAMGLGVQLGFS